MRARRYPRKKRPRTHWRGSGHRHCTCVPGVSRKLRSNGNHKLNLRLLDAIDSEYNKPLARARWGNFSVVFTTFVATNGALYKPYTNVTGESSYSVAPRNVRYATHQAEKNYLLHLALGLRLGTSFILPFFVPQPSERQRTCYLIGTLF